MISDCCVWRLICFTVLSRISKLYCGQAAHFRYYLCLCNMIICPNRSCSADGSQLRIPLWWVQHNLLLLRGTRWLTHEGWEKLGHRLVKTTYVTNISLPTAHHVPRGPVQHHSLTHIQLSNINTFEDMAQDTDMYSIKCTTQRWLRAFDGDMLVKAPYLEALYPNKYAL